MSDLRGGEQMRAVLMSREMLSPIPRGELRPSQLVYFCCVRFSNLL